MNKIRHYYRINDTFEYKNIEDVYDLHKPNNKKLQKIIKFIVNLLVKMNVLKPYTEAHRRVRFEEVEINYKKLHDAILEQIIYYQSKYRKNVKTIVLGKDQLEELNIDINCPLTIDFPCPYDLKFMGIEVVCLPHIDGMFVIPETS